MSLSDDRFKSNFHRVRAQSTVNDRYSIAYFNQASKDTLIKGPLGKYPPMTGGEYIRRAMDRNYTALKMLSQNPTSETVSI